MDIRDFLSRLRVDSGPNGKGEYMCRCPAHDDKNAKETVEAVKAFQLDRGLTADGIAGEATLAALNAGQDNTYTVTLHGVPEAKAIALISLYNGEIHGALG